MIDLKEVFKALPHVQTIWVTKDGHFHLHPNNGGERVDRDELNDDDDQDKDQDKKKTVKEIVELINAAENADQINEIVGDDDRSGVKKAAEKRIASFNNI